MLVFEYYYNRFRQQRKNCKNLVDANNFVTARTNLQNMLTEHQNAFPNSDTNRNFNYSEKLLIQHALNHLNAVINKNDPSFRDSDGQLRHQSDIVKNALVETPEQSN